MKKIRNPGRHIRQYASLHPTPELLPAGALPSWHYHYNKLGLGVWHWHGRQPPRHIRQLAVVHLLNTFFAWEAQLKTQKEDYYLAIWLVSPDFAHNSQVAAGIHERIARYEGMTGGPILDGPALPPEYQQLPGAEQLTWHTHRWETLLDTIDYPNNWPAWALQKPNHLYTHHDGSHYLVVQTGWLWVGQRA